MKTAKEILHKHACISKDGFLAGQVKWIVEAMEEYASQPKPLDDGQDGKGLRWVKASERLPGKNWEGRVKTMGLDGNWIYQTLKGWQVERLLTHELDLQAEWLDESAALPLADGEGEKVEE